ncbi:MAG: membrane protein insertion efficiency factor YidD [Candidatus Paracaedibacteraceae bacterium]|nr:membrane protein insertion efficiency factor YidD [Candidatus Paracaedibacteraceae bacterium]
MIAKLLIGLIHLYRWLISPYLPARCRFVPTCSAYAVHALHHHGLKKGLYLVARRLIRCHPIEKLGAGYGYDPVPEYKSSGDR